MKRIFSQKTLLLVLALGLTASLTLNIALLQKQREEVPLDLRGTYQVGPMYGAIYLLLDGEGHFCRYTQETGVLDEGTCREQGDGYYTLQASDGGGYSLLRVDGGILLFDAGDNTLTQYEKRDNALFFASIPGPWPEWCGL
ncbi:hypothetical protein H9X91_00865 [Oscillibacter valericigenes]|uniref:Transmembrane protein n=1 Tax=Oscillibacter valericigenes TaxID=351091 RepID=A0ABS2FSY3_9FIRM|nr:hypothetical protein [Oscillibacter valericigenes]MBM6849987.1 hypothetical protein [Oscillibacter valericigenes]